MSASVAVAAPQKERVAVIDVGPADNGLARRTVAAAIIAGGLDAVIGDGIDDALAGEDITPDAARLAAAMAEAQRAYGALDCAATLASANVAIGIAAARQAAQLATPELPRAWTYVLLCADRGGDARLARTAATRLRTLGATTEAADTLAKYPEVDALLDHETYPIELAADVAGAVIYIDHERAGVSPLTTRLAAGDHVIAAATSTGRRGFAMGTAVKTQTQLAIPTLDQRGAYGAIAKRISGWGGVSPAASEIAEVMNAVKIRAIILRRGDVIEAWGRPGRVGEPHRLGGEDGVGAVADAPRLVALIADRAQTWNDRSPDPDQVLLTEDTNPMKKKDGRVDEPARWWVYAALGAAVIGGGTLLYFSETAGTTQRVELHIP